MHVALSSKFRFFFLFAFLLHFPTEPIFPTSKPAFCLLVREVSQRHIGKRCLLAPLYLRSLCWTSSIFTHMPRWLCVFARFDSEIFFVGLLFEGNLLLILLLLCPGLRKLDAMLRLSHHSFWNLLPLLLSYSSNSFSVPKSTLGRLTLIQMMPLRSVPSLDALNDSCNLRIYRR